MKAIKEKNKAVHYSEQSKLCSKDFYKAKFYEILINIIITGV